MQILHPCHKGCRRPWRRSEGRQGRQPQVACSGQLRGAPRTQLQVQALPRAKLAASTGGSSNPPEAHPISARPQIMTRFRAHRCRQPCPQRICNAYQRPILPKSITILAGVHNATHPRARARVCVCAYACMSRGRRIALYGKIYSAT